MTEHFTPDALEALQPGQVIARGVMRMLAGFGFASIDEFVPTRGLRVDVAAVGRKGEIWVVECKSSRADFMTDHKWQNYLPWCDRYFWAVGTDFPRDILPDGMGVIVADGYGGELLHMPPETKLAAARRSVLMRKIARHAMRQHALTRRS